MCIVEITEKAESDLDSISDYLAITLANPLAANALLDEIEDAIDHIEDDPEIFPLCLDSRLADLGYRKAVVESYIMIYDVDSDGATAHVLRFFHGSEDYPSKL